jgi:hypothetical protein
VLNFCAHQQTSYVLGNCNESLIKVFNIPGNTFIYCHDEAGIGPTATMLNAYADGMIKGFVFDANASSCNINAVNSTLACFNFNNYSDLATSVYGAQSTANFHGKARFFNTSLFAAPYVDVLMDAGDLGFELLHTHNGSTIGSQVNGGVFHMINLGAHHDGTPPAYNVAFGTGAGIGGQTSELIGSYAYNGFTFSNPNQNNAVNIWTDYSLSTYTILNGSGGSGGKKLVPGTTVSLLAMADGKYVTAANATTALIANSTTVGTAQQFMVVDAGSGNIGLRALSDNQYVCADNAGANPLIANRTAVGAWETYTEVDAGNGNIGLLAMANSHYVCADNAGANPLIANRTAVGAWETFTVGVIGGGVVFYQDTGYGGAAGQALAKGTYTQAQLQANNVPAKWASSVKIPAGWTVIMYANDNFGGTSWTLTSDTPNFTTLSPNANDQMSSCKIQ